MNRTDRQIGTVADLHFVGFDFGGLPECFVEQVATPPAQRAHPFHLLLMAALMGQKWFVIAVLRVDDDQVLADGEASSEEQQTGVKNHDQQSMASANSGKVFMCS